MFARFKSHWSVIPAISVGIIFVFHNADPGESREARFHVRQDLRQTGSKAIAPAKQENRGIGIRVGFRADANTAASQGQNSN